MMTTSRKLLLLPLICVLLTVSLIESNGRTFQTDEGSAPKVQIAVPANNLVRYGLGLTFVAGTVEGTEVSEVGISIRRVGTNEEWQASKKSGRFVKGPTGKWLKASLNGNEWYVPTSSYKLPSFDDLLPAGVDEMRYIIYVYAKDKAGRRSEEEGTMFTVRR